MKPDPTLPMRDAAAGFLEVSVGTSCNQTAFKAGKGAFFYVGPGPKGRGFKAMFKLDSSLADAEELAAESPERFQVGSTRWVTARFTAEDPLSRSVWEPWLDESYELCTSRSRKKAP